MLSLSKLRSIKSMISFNSLQEIIQLPSDRPLRILKLKQHASSKKISRPMIIATIKMLLLLDFTGTKKQKSQLKY